MLKLLLSAVFVSLLFACNQPKTVLQKSPYESDVTHFANRLDGKKKKTKHLEGLEVAFQQAQIFDLALIDSLLEEGKPELWPAINTLHRRLKIRQEKITALQPLRAKNGYEPNLRFVTEMTKLEADSRQKAATYLYDKAQTLVTEATEKGNRPAAREAFYTLQDLKQNYYRYWENANALLDSARLLGISHILLTNLPSEDTAASKVFWKEVSTQARRAGDEWHVYYSNFSPTQQYDYVVECRIKSINIGAESRSESTRSEEKDIEVGYEEIKDTSGRVIEKKPVYEHVRAEVREISLSKEATGILAVEVHNIHTNELLFSKDLQASYKYTEQSACVSGDSRALTFSPSGTCNLFPSSPVDSTMSDRLMDDMESQLYSFLKKNMAKW